MQFNFHTGFIGRDSIFVCDNTAIHTNGGNSESIEKLKSMWIDTMTLPTHSLELSPIKLVLSVIVQKFASHFKKLT